MNRRLRRRHLRWVAAIATLVAILFVAALVSRPAPVPSVDLPEAVSPGSKGDGSGS